MIKTRLPAHRRRAIARELLIAAPVFSRHEAWVARLQHNNTDVDFASLLSQGTWSTGELLILETAAAIDGRPIQDASGAVDLRELRSRLDDGNYQAVLSALAQLK